MLSEPEPTQAEPPSSVFGSATSQSGLHGPTNKRARPPHRIEGNLSLTGSCPTVGLQPGEDRQTTTSNSYERYKALPIVNKDIIRNMVWDHLDSANLVRFPR